MKKEDIRAAVLMVLGIVGAGLALVAIVVLPSFDFNGTEVRLFAPNRLVRPDIFRGRVLGDHLLETEHGEIKLRHLSEVLAVRNGIGWVEIQEFREGRASHNLVVNGIEIPPDVDIAFNDLNRIFSIRMHGSLRATQEVIVSGIPLDINELSINPRRSVADIEMVVRNREGSVTLADSTVIELMDFPGALRFFKEDERWELEIARWRRTGFLVKLPGETEFAEYRSIRFRADWGEFIEGVLFE
ncbi:MAG: hypothetical protein FWC64_09495 [Treponema sp.]|nr:hypothetical protein [Treponema sp.]